MYRAVLLASMLLFGSLFTNGTHTSAKVNGHHAKEHAHALNYSAFTAGVGNTYR